MEALGNVIRLVRRGGLALTIVCVIFATAPAQSAVRIKDIADFEGIRDNLLIGYGLVVGLDGSGDTLNRSPFTAQSLETMLERLGVKIDRDDANTRNLAAVMVTATLPPFARHGTRIDISVSSLGDADDLRGGTLLVTPLLGADGEVYAVAQGQLTVSGFQAEGAAGTSVTQGVPTNGRIANGAIVEREVGFELASLDRLDVSLRNPDLTTARRIAQTINAFLGEAVARTVDPATVTLSLPAQYQNDVAGLLTEIEQLRVEPDQVARVVIDDTSGTIVMGQNVRISTVAIAQGNLTIRITETPQISQPGAFAPEGATTERVERTEIEVEEDEDRQMVILPEGVSLQELVDGLNALGVGPRDIISILQTIKAAGALQAEMVIM